MSESALSLGYADIASTVARTAFGYSPTSTDWDAGELDDINKSIDKGYSDFLGENRWTFLTQVATITTSAPYATGTIDLVNGDATVTLTDGVFPSWAEFGTLYYAGNEYEVSSRTDDTHIELRDAWAADSASAVDYSLRRIYYALPDDFSNPTSFFTYSNEYDRSPLKRIGEDMFRALRNTNTSTNQPTSAALRPKTTDYDGTAGTRWEVMFYPLSDGAYNLSYSYDILGATQLRTDTPYPLGGQAHAQAVQDCCIAAARYLFRDTNLGEYRSAIGEACRRSIEIDGRTGPSSLGLNRDNSDNRGVWYERDSESRKVTVNGQIPGY